MKILILGNGFDLDHGLPTSYKDFLVFCNYVLDMDRDESLLEETLQKTKGQISLRNLAFFYLQQKVSD